MSERLLPEDLLLKASVSGGGEHAWRKNDVEAVLEAARDASLASLGGQPQFQLPDGTCEPYWLNYGSDERRPDEPWQDFVDRSVDETSSTFRRICQKTDFQREARQWQFLKEKIDHQGYDPLQDLWFVISLVTEEEYRSLSAERP